MDTKIGIPISVQRFRSFSNLVGLHQIRHRDQFSSRVDHFTVGGRSPALFTCAHTGFSLSFIIRHHLTPFAFDFVKSLSLFILAILLKIEKEHAVGFLQFFKY